MIRWPVDLISDIARRRTVVFLGSGISKNSTGACGKIPKTWLEFLEYAVEQIDQNKHIKKLIKEKDYLTACEVIKKSLGRESFNKLLRDEFLSPGYNASDIHKYIFKLDSRIVATPNFDKIYETYANHEASGSIVIKNHYDPDIAELIKGTDRIILKIHGTIDSAERMIFTRKEYAEAREKNRSFYNILEALSLTHTFLFLGCGVNDPDIRLLLEENSFRHPSSRPHIFVLPEKELHDSVKVVLQESMNLNILSYKNSSGVHSELLNSIIDLVRLVEEQREQLKLNSNW